MPFSITVGSDSSGAERATSNDTGGSNDGNRVVVVAGDANTEAGGVVSGNVAVATSATTGHAMFGYEVGGSGASAPDRAGDLWKQYLAPYSSHLDYVGR